MLISRTINKNEYRGSRRFSESCRSHEGCPYCENGHKHKEKEASINEKEQLKELNMNCTTINTKLSLEEAGKLLNRLIKYIPALQSKLIAEVVLFTTCIENRD